jgi:DNA repair protein RecO (recombination protein O)
MLSLRCEALVLGTMDYRESDRIVTIFTLEHGKIKGIARGAKKSVRRFGASLELFARISAELVLREGLSGIISADILTLFPAIRKDLAKIGLAGYACELADALLPEGMCNPRLFRLLNSYLEHLDSSPATPSDRRFFEMNFLNVLGYCPSLEQCARCAGSLHETAWSRDAMAANGLLCASCGRGGKQVSLETVTLLRSALRKGRFGIVHFSPTALEEAGSFLDRAIAAHLQRPLKALSFLREIGE